MKRTGSRRNRNVRRQSSQPTASETLCSGNTHYTPTSETLRSGNTHYTPTSETWRSGNTHYTPTSETLRSGNTHYTPMSETLRSGNTYSTLQRSNSDVVAVLRGYMRIRSAHFGRSQGIRRMLSASSNKNKLPFISSEILLFSAHVRFWNRFEIHNYIIIYIGHANRKLHKRAGLLMNLSS